MVPPVVVLRTRSAGYHRGHDGEYALMKRFANRIGYVVVTFFTLAALVGAINVSQSSREVSASGFVEVMVLRGLFVLLGVGLILYGRRKPPLD